MRTAYLTSQSGNTTGASELSGTTTGVPLAKTAKDTSGQPIGNAINVSTVERVGGDHAAVYQVECAAGTAPSYRIEGRLHPSLSWLDLTGTLSGNKTGTIQLYPYYRLWIISNPDPVAVTGMVAY